MMVFAVLVAGIVEFLVSVLVHGVVMEVGVRLSSKLDPVDGLLGREDQHNNNYNTSQNDQNDDTGRNAGHNSDGAAAGSAAVSAREAAVTVAIGSGIAVRGIEAWLRAVSLHGDAKRITGLVDAIAIARALVRARLGHKVDDVGCAGADCISLCAARAVDTAAASDSGAPDTGKTSQTAEAAVAVGKGCANQRCRSWSRSRTCSGRGW